MRTLMQMKFLLTYDIHICQISSDTFQIHYPIHPTKSPGCSKETDAQRRNLSQDV